MSHWSDLRQLHDDQSDGNVSPGFNGRMLVYGVPLKNNPHCINA